jgi:predicted 3-demethylubiquinone-9 3-methyltransferase (glyoxalase superfamily)
MHVSAKVAPCLWFDSQAEEAAKFYVSIFKKKIDIDELERAVVGTR